MTRNTTCYRASWQLPGPDLHRLADTGLRVNHLNVTTSWSSLCTHAAGHTKLGLEGTRFRLVVAEGEILDTAPLPALEMPYGQFRPASGLRACLDGWLRAGGPHHEVLNLGHHAASWRAFCELTGIEYVQV